MCSLMREIQKKAVIDVAIFPRIILVNRRHVAQSCGCLLFGAAQRGTALLLRLLARLPLVVFGVKDVPIASPVLPGPPPGGRL